MKIINIETLKKNINQSTVLIFLVIFSSAITGLYLTHNKFIQKHALLNKQEIISAGNIYKSNLSEKLSLIASSTVFLDYLRSGNETRKRLYFQFFSQVSSLKSKSVSAMQLIDSDNKTIFYYGKKTPHFISIKLCYLNQTLDHEMGNCNFSWKLYFNEIELLKEMLSINNAITICKHCNYYNLVDNKEFGSFPINNSSDFKLRLKIIDENDYFYVYFLLMTVTLVLFGTWSWCRLSSILNRYIANPIKHLTNCLKANHSLDQKNNIEEIQYLIDEINAWKVELNKIQTAENTEKLSEIAAQLAHDVRSPLSAIDMLVKNLTNVPEDYRVTLHNATQRIYDIANNFLSQYKNTQLDHIEPILSNECIPSLLENIVSEKRSQYTDRNIEISLCVDNNAWDIFSFVDPMDFKRVLSNLINNSIEAISESGYVRIKLIKHEKYLIIEIVDNGCGITANLLPKIIISGVSIGKKNGSGLGLTHAIKKVKEWNGTFDIKSNIDIGTEINIKLPLSEEAASWFMTSLSLPNDVIICILDDETNTHHLWENRLLQTKHSLSSIQHFFTPDDMKKFIEDHTYLDIIYLIDYEIGHHHPTGLDIIEQFHISKTATLVTNRYDDVKVQNRCVDLGVKIIPKNLIQHIPIHS